MIDFNGKCVIVTGAGGGLGRAYAQAFGRREAHVVVNDIGRSADGESLSRQVADEIASFGGSAIVNEDDVSTVEGARRIIQDAVGKCGRIDALVNNAGNVYGQPLREMNVDSFDPLVNVHLKGSFNLSREAVFATENESDELRIVNVSSAAGLFGMRGMAAYAAVKAGVYSLTRTMAVEWRDLGVFANCVFPVAATNPGRTPTAAEILDNLGEAKGRANTDFVAPLVVYLASDQCRESAAAYSAVAGRFARIFIGVTSGWWSPLEEPPPSAEEIGRRIDEVGDLGDFDIRPFTMRAGAV